MIRIGLLCAALGCGESKPTPAFRCLAPYMPVCVDYDQWVLIPSWGDPSILVPVKLHQQVCECAR